MPASPYLTMVVRMSPGIFAIVGVLIGSIATYLVQNLMARRAESFERQERLRRERMEVYSAFAAEAMDARRAQINRWYQRKDAGRGSAEYDEAKADSYRGRTEARRERYRIELVADDPDLTGLAEAVVESLGAIHKGSMKAQMEERAERTRTLVESFVTAAADQIGMDRRRSP